MKNDYKKNLQFVFFVIIMCFGFIIFFLIRTVYLKDMILSNSYNPRIGRGNILIERGKIFDAKGNLLADNFENGERNYLYPEIFAHIIGYKNIGGAGIERKYDYELSHSKNEFICVLKKIFTGQKIYAEDIYLTVDKNLQEFIFSVLKNKGAVIVMEPSSGKILSMVSNPSFNPNNVEKLKSDKENAPLLNRATQGLYPPGSVFKIITTIAAMRHINLNEFNYNCRGIEIFDNDKIHCFNSHVHGKENIKTAFAVSCNTFFATLGDIIGNKNLLTEIKNICMNKDFDFELEYNTCSFGLKDNSDRSELIQTSIGQGKTLVTPLYMAMLTSAIANCGKMMKPYIVQRIGSNLTKPKEIAQVFTNDEANFMTDLMEEVVAGGTAKKIYIKNMKLAGKTGSAENSSGKDHGWFVVFDKENDFAISILLENSNGSIKAVNLAKQIINFMLNE